MIKIDTINIVSNTYKNRKFTGGPGKVVTNTIKSLQELGYPFVINQNISDYEKNWIHDSINGLVQITVSKIPAVVGPNIVVLPKDLPRLLPSLEHCIYLHPSDWPRQMWYNWGFNDCPIHTWSAGIDIKKFSLKTTPLKNNKVLIYFKRRNPELLSSALKIVESLNYKCFILEYGGYAENEFINLLQEVSFCIWIGVSESQGIAMMEAMAANVPIIVLNVKSLFEDVSPNSYIIPSKLKGFIPTSAPYFDNRCGYIIDEINDLEKTINILINDWQKLNPRSYVEENHSLKKSSLELIKYFELLNNKNVTNFSLINSIKCAAIYSEYFIEKQIRKLVTRK